VNARSRLLGRLPENRSQRLLIMGPPGAGKGTQARVIADQYAIPAISTGEILRNNVANGTPLGVQVQHIMATGGYLDDEITNAVVASRLDQADTRDGFILDGYPRTLPQVLALDRLLTEQATGLTAVIVLVAEPEEVTARLLTRASQQRRADDTARTIQERQRVYQQQTAPLLDAYRERHLVLEVDALGAPAEVTQRILTRLETSRKVQL